MAQPAFIVRTDESIPNRVTPTGFVFGAATVQRLCTLPKGAVALRVETNKEAFTIIVSKGGKVKIENKAKQMAVFAPATGPKPAS